jgi:CRISPR-associated Csx2 family protein
MARVFLAFLGTNDYLPCTYYAAAGEAAGVRFVQEATVQLFCQEWGEGDRILILTTDEARRKNWRDDGHLDRDGNPLRREGLARRLGELGLNARVERVPIPEGRNAGEIWQVFQTLSEQLQDGDEVVFDITHALRHIPMLALAALNYAKVLKGVSLQGIYYGAFEVLGSIREAEKLPVAQRRVPIFDLAAFDALLDWGVAVDRFLGAGDAAPLAALAQRAVKPILMETRGQDAAARAIRRLAQRLEDFTAALATCRGPRLGEIVRLLKEDLEGAVELEVLPPLKPLLARVAARLRDFPGDFIRDGLQSARWCLDHNLIQQGFTILQEFLISWLVQRQGLDDTKLAHRELVNQALTISQKQLPPETWKREAREHRESVQGLLAFFEQQPSWVRIFSDLNQCRNDLNHAAFRGNSRSAGAFRPKLEELLSAAQEELAKASGS